MKKLILKSKLTNLLKPLIILMIFSSCTQPTDNEKKAGEFEIQTKYSKTRSCNRRNSLSEWRIPSNSSISLKR